MNEAPLRQLIIFLKLDPSDLRVEGHSQRSAIPSRNTPVNLCEHLGHLLRIDYQDQQFRLDPLLARTLGIDPSALRSLCYLGAWPDVLRRTYRLASTDRVRAAVVIRRIEVFIDQVRIVEKERADALARGGAR